MGCAPLSSPSWAKLDPQISMKNINHEVEKGKKKP
jgi:hypothetical protein